jgi:hypothetical protein
MRPSPNRAGAAIVAVLALALTTTAPGCNPGESGVDRSALYSPESLAAELSFRYRDLKPEARKLTRDVAPQARPGDRERARQIDEKVEQKKGGGDETPKKRSGPRDLDDVMDDVNAKIDKVPGTPRPEVYTRMIDALSRDGSLSEADRKLLADRLEQLGKS